MKIPQHISPPEKGWPPLILLTILTAGTLIISVISLQLGWTTIFQNLFYFPIIFACVYYVKRGFVFSVLLACSYFFLMACFSLDPEVIGGALIRLLFFILIAGVITYLSMIRIKAEAALRESERRLGEIIDFLPDPTFAIDTTGTVIAWNRAIEAMTGCSKADMLGKGDYEYSSLIYGEKRPVLIDLVLHDDPEQRKKYNVLPHSGDHLIAEIFAQQLNGGKGEHLWIIASPLYDSAGTITGSIESIRIVTDRKREEVAFKTANKKITMLNSITRHDILNQLLALRGYLELSKQKNNDPRIAEFINKEEKAAEAIQLQIEFTRTYQDIGTQAPKWQNLEEIIGSAIVQLKPVITEMNFTLNDGEIFADPLLEKVFYNLMENSLRHGDHVTRIDFSAQETENGLIVSYSDNGVGITTDDKKKLFRKGFGKHTGLGLFLSSEILAITGITICETGEPGKGARFEMTVPKEAWRMAGADQKAN
jgi:PAS domain S-box-containing protein